MWAVCITSINHVLKLNGYGRRQAKVNGKRLRFKGWETLVNNETLHHLSVVKCGYVSENDLLVSILSLGLYIMT